MGAARGRGRKRPLRAPWRSEPGRILVLGWVLRADAAASGRCARLGEASRGASWCWDGCCARTRPQAAAARALAKRAGSHSGVGMGAARGRGRKRPLRALGARLGWGRLVPSAGWCAAGRSGAGAGWRWGAGAQDFRWGCTLVGWLRHLAGSLGDAHPHEHPRAGSGRRRSRRLLRWQLAAAVGRLLSVLPAGLCAVRAGVLRAGDVRGG